MYYCTEKIEIEILNLGGVPWFLGDWLTMVVVVVVVYVEQVV